MSPSSKAQQKATAKYVKNNYDEIKIRVPKGHREILQSHAQTQNESLNAFANRAFNETMERDNSELDAIKEAQAETGIPEDRIDWDKIGVDE